MAYRHRSHYYYRGKRHTPRATPARILKSGVKRGMRKVMRFVAHRYNNNFGPNS